MGLLYNFLSGKLTADRASNSLIVARAKEMTNLYEGGQRSRNRGNAYGTFQSPEGATATTERLQMILEARDLEDNFPIADMILNVYDVYAFGTIRYQPMTGDVNFNNEISEFLKEWFAECEYTGRFDFQKTAQMAQRGKKRDGESGIVHIIDENGDYKIQLITGDRIGNPNTILSNNLNDQNGILVDDGGRVLGYELYSRRSNSSVYTFDKFIPQGHFSHVFDPTRADAYHGVTAFKSVITRMRDMKETLEYSRINIKYRATQLPYMKTDDGEVPSDVNHFRDNQPPKPTHDEAGVKLEHVEGGEQQYMRTTEGVFEFPNDFPNGTFLPVIETQAKEIFAGVGLSYDFSWKVDKLTGTVGRLVVEREDRVMQIERSNSERQWMNMAIRRAIQNGIDQGRIKGDSATKFKGAFFYGARITADYGRDAKADIELVNAGLLTETEYQHIHGRHPEDVRTTRLEETLGLIQDGKKVAEKSGLSVDNATNLIRKVYPQPPTIQSVSETTQPGAELERR
jgi:capsid protein